MTSSTVNDYCLSDSTEELADRCSSPPKASVCIQSDGVELKGRSDGCEELKSINHLISRAPGDRQGGVGLIQNGNSARRFTSD